MIKCKKRKSNKKEYIIIFLPIIILLIIFASVLWHVRGGDYSLYYGAVGGLLGGAIGGIGTLIAVLITVKETRKIQEENLNIQRNEAALMYMPIFEITLLKVTGTKDKYKLYYGFKNVSQSIGVIFDYRINFYENDIFIKKYKSRRAGIIAKSKEIKKSFDLDGYNKKANTIYKVDILIRFKDIIGNMYYQEFRYENNDCNNILNGNIFIDCPIKDSNDGLSMKKL